jgi:hypothetical protein
MNKRKFNKLAGMELLSKRSKVTVADVPREAIERSCLIALVAFENDAGSEIHWGDLTYCLNIARMLIYLSVMPEGLNVIQHAQNALDAVRASGTWRLGSHNFAISCGVKMFIRQLRVATNQQVKAAIAEVLKRNEQSREGSAA